SLVLPRWILSWLRIDAPDRRRIDGEISDA
ncbi:MAG: hypothetical protein ACI8TQ_003719, partial [Planctomycetota bacterium]